MSAKLSADPDNFQALSFLIRALEDLQILISSSGQRREQEKRGEGKRKEEEKKKKEKVKAVLDCTGLNTLKKHKVTC